MPEMMIVMGNVCKCNRYGLGDVRMSCANDPCYVGVRMIYRVCVNNLLSVVRMLWTGGSWEVQ